MDSATGVGGVGLASPTEAIAGPSSQPSTSPAAATASTSTRPRRVLSRPSPLSTPGSSSSSQTQTITYTPPSLPLRSPLRPPARSISTQSHSSTESPSPNTSTSNSNRASSNTSTLTLDSPVSPQTPTDDPAFVLALGSISDLALPPTPAQFQIQMRDRHNSFPSLDGLIVDPHDIDIDAEIDRVLALTMPTSDMDALLSRRKMNNFNENLGLSLSLNAKLQEKELPERPETPLSVDLEDLDREQEQDDISATGTGTSHSYSHSNSNSNSSLASSTAASVSLPPQPSAAPAPTAPAPAPPTMSKRHHAMHELLSSERAYASDLSLIREVHIPLALGQQRPLEMTHLILNAAAAASSASASASTTTSTTTGTSTITSLSTSTSSKSSSSTRTTSTSSGEFDLSAPPMTLEDVRTIFSNIIELAILADEFAEKLEFALGSVVEGGKGEDFIGRLFLSCVPRWEKPYNLYITRHPSALQHLQNLPQTPVLTAYLAHTQRVASEYSHAWDLASLLIKPVQRLLKYPLLLSTIIDETPDGHPDKDNLRAARERIEELARNVNEGRRRAEVVKDVLTSKGVKKPNAPVGVAAGVGLSKVKSLKYGGVTAATLRATAAAAANGEAGVNGSNGNSNASGEAAQVEAMAAELKRIEVFAQQFARNVVDWGKMMSNMMLALRTWALSFGKVIGLSPELGQRSEAFDAFIGGIRDVLMPLTADLEAAINERLLKSMAHLLMTMNQPLKLLASMSEQEPYHYHLLTMPVSAKNRPPASLLAASTNYLALRGQLAAELPSYLRLLHQGFHVFITRLAAIQTRFWRDVKEHWAELWEMLRVESELNVGWEETCAVWCARWADVDEVVRALGIMQPVPHVQPTPRVYYYAYPANATPPVSAPVTQTQAQMPPQVVAPAPEFAEYFAYPGYYMPMTPVAAPPQKERRESASSGSAGNKLEKKSSGHSTANATNGNTGGGAGAGGKNGAAAATVQSMFAALEPAHSPVHKKTSLGFGVGGSGAASSSTANIPAAGYSVSGPLPLGSVPVPVHREREREGKRDRERERGRGRGASDASALASGKNGYGYGYSSTNNVRRPSSQDSNTHAQQQQQQQQSPPPPHQLRQQPTIRTPPSRRRTQGGGMAEEFAEYVASGNGNGHGNGHEGMPPPYEGGQYPYSFSPPSAPAATGGGTSPRQGITRMKSMPLSTTRSTGGGGGSGGGYVDAVERAYHRSSNVVGHEESWEEYQAHQQQHQHQAQHQREETMRRVPSERGRERERERERERDGERDRDRERARLSKPSRPTEPSPKRKAKEHSRKRSGSVKSITSFFTSAASAPSNPHPSNTAPPDPQPLTPSQRDSWVSKPAKYICQAIHPCRPPPAIQYYSFPFFTLKEGELYEVLQEAGHPSIHPKLPLYVDDGEDCLLLCRDGRGVVGWALASFLEPINIG